MNNLRTALSAALLAAFVLLAAGHPAAEPLDSARGEQAKPAANAPAFKVDPGWPLEMPNNWIMGAVTGVFVDAKQHVWVAHLPETLTEEELYEEPWKVGAGVEPGKPKPVQLGTCCKAAPPILEFDPQGKLVQGWGQGSFTDFSDWPRDPHGIFVDHTDHVWVGSHSRHRVMKFTRQGKLVLQIGEYEKVGGSADQKLLGGPSGIWVDPRTNEAFISDGYRNRRVVVVDGATGAYKRHWGAYGKVPDDTEKFDPKTMMSGALPSQFSTPHGITGSRDGRIYVTDRRGNRVQVFDQSGKYIAEKIIAPATLSSGSSFVPVLSPDPQQQWLYVADGTNHKIWILRRSDLEIVGEFGRGGRFLGQMLRPHGMSADNQGNLYVGEASTGRRVQKFTLQKGSQADGRTGEQANKGMRDMKKMLLTLAIVLGAAAPAFATWSVIAIDAKTGQVIIASSTCVRQQGFPERKPNGARDLMDVQAVIVPGVGVAACQAGVDNTRENQMLVYNEIKKGTPPADIIEMLKKDPNVERRQFGIVSIPDGKTITPQNNRAGFNGSGNSRSSLYFGGAYGDYYYQVQGNTLLGDQVVYQAALAFTRAKGTLADHVMAAMEAADAHGGDHRCNCGNNSAPNFPCDNRTSHVAYIAIANKDDQAGVTHNDGKYFAYLAVGDNDIRKGESANPVKTLRMRYDAWVKAGARRTDPPGPTLY